MACPHLPAIFCRGGALAYSYSLFHDFVHVREHQCDKRGMSSRCFVRTQSNLCRWSSGKMGPNRFWHGPHEGFLSGHSCLNSNIMSASGGFIRWLKALSLDHTEAEPPDQCFKPFCWNGTSGGYCCYSECRNKGAAPYWLRIVFQ